MTDVTPALFRRVKAIVSGALDRDEPERTRYVDDACAGDEALRLEVESLLDATARAEDHFESPAGRFETAMPGDLEIGSTIGVYRVVKALGAGGMGAVYLAQRADGDFQQRVAVKVVRSGFPTPFLLERFREERRILASLEHPNIARLIDGGTTEAGLPYVAMEYVEGEPIDEFCRLRGLDVPRRLEIFRQVCAAVHYAHQHLVVHRDIKAANVLVTEDGAPKLLDFGIAKLAQPGPAGDQPLTRYRIATPESASPEQLQGKPITIATDVYALGVLLFRLLTGQSPYGSQVESEADLIRAVCDSEPAAPSVVARGSAIPYDLDVIVLKALRKEPERRYGTAEQLSADVGRLLAGHPVLAAADSFTYRARKFVRRNRVALLGVVGVAGVLAAGVGSTLWQARQARGERERAERQFNAVRTLGASVLGELHDAVSRLEGSLGAREILLRRATEYLDALAGEAGDNLALRREIADGYIRLAQVQGAPGVANLGDRAAAKRSYEKTLMLLGPLAARTGANPVDSLGVIQARLGLDSLAGGEEPRTDLDQALSLLESLPASVRALPRSLTLEGALWNQIALRHVRAKDYPKLRDARRNQLRAAEAVWRSDPDDLNAARSVSLACKQLGAVLEVLKSPDEARLLYDRALALDQARVDREPGRSVWQLDLSFALGSIAGLLQAAGELDAALAQTHRAVELRRAVVAAEPNDDFARGSLVNGYRRLAAIEGRRGRVVQSIGWEAEAIALRLAQLRAHPERDQVWRDYAQTAHGAITASLTLLERSKGTARVPRASLVRLEGMLQTLTETHARWTKEGRAGRLPVSEEDLRLAAGRVRRLRTAERL
jgi:non-specific serine/threonine protein kinase/serine/threonine-protein kinase